MQESTEKNEAESNLEDQPSESEVVDAAPLVSVTEESMEVDEEVLQEKQDLATDLEQVNCDVDRLPENVEEPKNMEHLEENASEETEGKITLTVVYLSVTTFTYRTRCPSRNKPVT